VGGTYTFWSVSSNGGTYSSVVFLDAPSCFFPLWCDACHGEMMVFLGQPFPSFLSPPKLHICLLVFYIYIYIYISTSVPFHLIFNFCHWFFVKVIFFQFRPSIQIYIYIIFLNLFFWFFIFFPCPFIKVLLIFNFTLQSKFMLCYYF